MKTFNALARIVLVGVLMAIAGTAAAQQEYPNKPIRIIVPFAPGGNTSLLARLVGQKLAESWGQQVIVDNRPGGNTIIGTEALLKAPSDGYTMLLVTSSHAINPLLMSNLPYDAMRDFAPVATLASSEYVLVVHPSLAANNLQQFIVLARSRPGQLNYSTAANGGVQQLASELFNIMAGVRIQGIPYKGGGAAVTDLIGGQVQLSFQNTPAVVSHINAGKLKGIAITGEKRFLALPQVPTFTQAGLPAFDVKNWFALLARSGTSKEIVGKQSSDIARALRRPDITEKLVGQGLDPFISTPEQFAALMKAEMVRYANVIKTANIRLEN